MFPKLVLLCLVASAIAIPDWLEFKSSFKKNYKSKAEETLRSEIFAKNVKKIKEHNQRAARGEVSFSLKVNQYSDLTPSEFGASMNGFRPTEDVKTTKLTLAPTLGAAPTSVNWGSQGLVTGVKDQKLCGSCYSFATTGALEGQWKKKYGTLRDLSEQNIVDCSRGYGNYGCSGGYMDKSYNYIYYNQGIDYTSAYPYTATDNTTCKFNRAAVAATIANYARLTPGEANLQNAVASVGPIAVAIDANHTSFYNYGSGVYYDPACNPNNLNHAVLVTGYGVYNNIPYWLVKNSWGTSWGMNGYVMMARNYNNHCGISNNAIYPIV